MQLACDISWYEAMFMIQFQFGLCGDAKDPMLTIPNPTTLSQVIVQVVHCDNQLVECRQKKHWELSPTLRPFTPPML
jgi:hypothetical protein